MKRNDRQALRLAIAHCREESPARAQQIDDFLRERDWVQVAKFAATCCQGRSLNLKPWQVCPCDLHADDLARDHHRGGRAALVLLERMHRCGVSRWHPDPVAAIEQAERSTSGAK